MIFTFLYYLLFSSAILIYAIGLNRATIVTHIMQIFPLIFKSLVATISSSVLSWLFIQYILIPLNLIELYPLVALLIFTVISIFLETIIRIPSGKVTSEFCISFLIVLISLNESLSYLDLFIINISCFLSFVLILPVLKVIKRRNSLVGTMRIHANYKTLILVSIAVLIMALAVFNVSWLNPEVIK